MRSRLWTALPFLLLLPLVGCRLIGQAVALPFVIVGVTLGGLAGIFIGAENVTEDEELWASGIRIEQRLLDVEVAQDLTFEGSLVVVSTVTSAEGLAAAQQASLSFEPGAQELELVSARVEHPDGSVVPVDPEHFFERPSAAERGAPGFVSGRTKSVLFPQLTVGSRTHVEWRFRETTASALGFHYMWRPSFALPVREAQIRIAYHEDVPLRFAAEAPWKLRESVDGDLRVVEVALRDYEGQVPEPAMVAPRDVCPKFVATTAASWESIGAAFHEAVNGSVEVTPEIAELAADIVGEHEGLAAARAIHRWVCTNIHYVAVYLHPMDGWSPHPASEVLANLYGDCKDKFALMASLLAAREIRAEAVLVNQDRGFEPLALPTPLQFNHCMLYLPDFDVYSNPTDPFRDLGELDAALSDKFVVHGTAQGRVARTPAGSADDHAYRAAHRVVVASDGVVTGTSVLDFKGRTAGNVRRRLASEDAGRAADHVLHADPLGGFGELETSEPTDLDTPLRCEGRWTSDIPIPMGPSIHFAIPSGIDFVNAPFLREFLSEGERRYPALVAATELHWHLELELPPGFAFDRLPADRAVETAVGRFTSRHSVTTEGRLVVERLLRIERDRIPAADYAGLRAMLLEVVADMGTIYSASIGT